MLEFSGPPRAAIDAVIFDAGGVLLLPDAQAGRRRLAALDVPTRIEDWHRAHYVGMQALDAMEVTDWHAHRQAFTAGLGVTADAVPVALAVVEQLFADRLWAPVDGAAAALRALAQAGYRLAVVSNSDGAVARQLADGQVCSVDGGSMPQVATVVDSHLVGVAKPDPRIFRFALDALGADPSRCLHVGDSVRFDVAGALAAGIAPVHLDPLGTCGGDHGHVRGLAELAQALTGGPAAAG